MGLRCFHILIAYPMLLTARSQCFLSGVVEWKDEKNKKLFEAMNGKFLCLLHIQTALKFVQAIVGNFVYRKGEIECSHSQLRMLYVGQKGHIFMVCFVVVHLIACFMTEIVFYKSLFISKTFCGEKTCLLDDIKEEAKGDQI